MITAPCIIGHSWEPVTVEVTTNDPGSYAGDGHYDVTVMECSECGEVSEDC